MASPSVRLDRSDLWRLVNELNIVTAIHDALAFLITDPERAVLFHPDRPARGDTGRVDATDWPIGELRALRGAGLAALAARTLLMPGVVTVGLAGVPACMSWHLAALCRFVPDISHIAVYGEESLSSHDLRKVLDRAGVGLSITSSAGDAAFGASLVIAVGAAIRDISVNDLARNVLVVNVGPDPTPLAIRERAGHCYAHEELAYALTRPDSHRAVPDEILLVEPFSSDVLNHLDLSLLDLATQLWGRRKTERSEHFSVPAEPRVEMP